MLTNTNLAGADVTGANFKGTRLTQEQLYSTLSYRRQRLVGTELSGIDLTGWDFRGQDLTDASFILSTLTDAQLAGAIITGLDLLQTRGFTKDQLYSTASYQRKSLRDIRLSNHDLSDWDLSGQDLAGARLRNVKLEATDLTGSNLKNADLRAADELTSAIVDSTTVYNQWTEFPSGFDVGSSGLTFLFSPPGDFNADDNLDANDIDRFSAFVRDYRRWDWLRQMFDLNNDGIADREDHRIWVKDLKHTWFGDADLDGQFNSNDLVAVFESGEYRDGIAMNSGWAEGDWNGDGDFDSSDLVAAFTDGGYDQGPRIAVNGVPEPTSFAMLFAGLIGITIRRRLGRL